MNDSVLTLTLLDLVAFEQGIDGWLLSTESLVERHRMLGATLREDVVTEALGGSSGRRCRSS